MLLSHLLFAVIFPAVILINPDIPVILPLVPACYD